MLDNTVLIHESPMGDSNLHNHKRVPFFIAGRGRGDSGRAAPEGGGRYAARERDAEPAARARLERDFLFRRQRRPVRSLLSPAQRRAGSRDARLFRALPIGR
jgi:hypothetical protein